MINDGLVPMVFVTGVGDFPSDVRCGIAVITWVLVETDVGEDSVVIDVEWGLEEMLSVVDVLTVFVEM